MPLHFIGDKDGLVYIAMAFVDGGALDAWVTDDPARQRSAVEVRRVMREVASALGHAHKRGVVHRDIKPHNVLVEAESGRCLVTDFGIASTVDGGRLTATGMMVGTPTYVAPEQVTGEASDHRADLYALGVMAWELLTGHAPFEAPTPTAALMERLGPPPPPVSDVRSGVPPELDAAIRACLEPDPALRVQSAESLLAILDGEVTATNAWSATFTRSVTPVLAAPLPALPVTGELFSEAANHCRWRYPDGGDLPTEEQWEAAARGAAGRLYPWGDEPDPAAANIAGAGRSAPARVGAFPRGATPEGVLDLVGNVWEWTRSPLVAYAGGAPSADSLAAYRVIRGGAWNAPPDVATASFRGYVRPEGPPSALALTGFRCIVPLAR